MNPGQLMMVVQDITPQLRKLGVKLEFWVQFVPTVKKAADDFVSSGCDAQHFLDFVAKLVTEAAASTPIVPST
jgi:hypothetical protein